MAKEERSTCFWNNMNFRLYCYYGLSTWNDQMWMFAAGMAFGNLGGNMQLTAAAAFAASAAILIFGPPIGRWIDNASRMRAAFLTLLITKICVTLTTALLALMLLLNSWFIETWNGEIAAFLSIICIFTNMVSVLGYSAQRIVVTKDWLVVICQGDDGRLTTTNAVLLRINLVSLVISPYLVGQLMVWTSIGITCLMIALFSAVTFFVEYFLLHALYRSVPELAKKRTDAEQPLISTPEANRKESRVRGVIRKFLNGWRTYSRQKILLAGISLSLLYMTVLGFDSITDVYAYSQGLKANTIALAKGCGAVSGILGSFAYPRVRRRIGLFRTGMAALLFELICLTLPLVSIWLSGSPFDLSTENFGADKMPDLENRRNQTSNGTCLETCLEKESEMDKLSISVFLTGIVLSRCGLWMADLTINQLFQKTVKEGERGSVNSVQNALNYLMEMLKSILVIFMPNPKTFGLLIILSYGSVFTACICYFIFSKRRVGKDVIETCDEDGWAEKPEKPSRPIEE